MPHSRRSDDIPLFEATKSEMTLRLDRDPHPGTTRYLVVEGPGLLVLFPKDGPLAESAGFAPVDSPSPLAAPDREGHLKCAFASLASRVSPSAWTSSDRPYADLIDAFECLAGQPEVSNDVSKYLAENPSVGHAIEMLFTCVSMSARAEWQVAPVDVRGIVARGWFLGRWVPTFLVLDGPILRFLKGPAFSRQSPPVPLLRAVRSFFGTKDLMSLRHAIAHWSFSWEVAEGDSMIVGTGKSAADTVRVSREEADAFHIITFALIEAIFNVFLREAEAGRKITGSAAIERSVARRPRKARFRAVGENPPPPPPKSS